MTGGLLTGGGVLVLPVELKSVSTSEGVSVAPKRRTSSMPPGNQKP